MINETLDPGDARAIARSQPGVATRGSTRPTHASDPCAWETEH